MTKNENDEILTLKVKVKSTNEGLVLLFSFKGYYNTRQGKASIRKNIEVRMMAKYNLKMYNELKKLLDVSTSSGG